MNVPLILRRGCVQVPLSSTTPTDAIIELVGLLAAQRLVSDKDSLAKSILEREAVRHTGLMKGFALPRGAARGVTDHCIAIGKLKEPINWAPKDNLKVDLVVLYVSPIPKTLDFLGSLVAIAKVCNKQNNRESLMKAATSDDLFNIATVLFSTQG